MQMLIDIRLAIKQGRFDGSCIVDILKMMAAYRSIAGLEVLNASVHEIAPLCLIFFKILGQMR